MLPGREELPVTEVERHLRDGERDEAQAHQDGTQDADEEGEVVPAADTLVEPLAVVVEDVDAFVADGAVFSFVGGDDDVTEMTPAVLYDVVVFGPVELGDRAFRVDGSEVGVTRVEKEGGEVGDIVETEDDGVEDDERQLDGGVEGRDEGEEGIDGEGGEEDPGYYLLGVEWRLETVDSSPFSKVGRTFGHFFVRNLETFSL